MRDGGKCVSVFLKDVFENVCICTDAYMYCIYIFLYIGMDLRVNISIFITMSMFELTC